MASESEVRQRAKQEGLNKSQEDAAVQAARNDPNLSADQAVQQARNQ